MPPAMTSYLDVDAEFNISHARFPYNSALETLAVKMPIR